MLKTRGKHFFAAIAAAAAVTTSCAQQAPQAQQQPATVTVTQPAPQEQTSSAGESEEQEAGATKATSPEEIPTQKPCKTSELRARFYPEVLEDLVVEPPGKSQTLLRLANVSGRACTIYGHARVEFADSNGAALPFDLVENAAGPSATNISIGTRQAVAQDFFWRFDAGACIDPDKISIYPPDNTEPIVLDWNLGRVCGGPQLEHGRLFPN